MLEGLHAESLHYPMVPAGWSLSPMNMAFMAFESYLYMYNYIYIYVYIYMYNYIYIHHMFSSINPYIFSQNKTTMITMYSTYSTTVPPFWNHPWSPWMLPTINIWRCWLYPSNVPISFNIHWITLSGWWLSHPSEKYESQLGWWHSQYMEK